VTTELAHGARRSLGPAAGRPVRPWLALAAVLPGTFLHTFDVMVISVAAPSIREEIGASAAAAQWMLAGYTLPFALLLITSGRLGDAVGRRRMVLIGSVGFTLASALCALAPDPATLIVGRVLQGVSAAAMTPQVLPVIVVLFPGARRMAALGTLAAVMSFATVSGPVVSGLLVQADLAGLGWRTVFLVNLPVGLFTMLAVPRWLPGGDTGHHGTNRPRLDAGSVALATVGLLMLIFPLVQGPELDWPLWTFGLLAGSVPVMLLVIGRQRRRERAGRFPLIAMSLFRQRSFVSGAVTNFLVIGGVAAFFLVFVIYLQSGLGFSPAEIGLTTAFWALATGIASAATLPLARKVGRPMLVAGALVMAAGMGGLLILVVTQGSELALSAVAASLAVVGLGMGMLSPPLYDLTLTDVPKQDAGSASGVLATAAQIGSALGVAAIGGLFFGVLSIAGNPDPQRIAATVAEIPATPEMAERLADCLHDNPLTMGTDAIVDTCAKATPGAAEPVRHFSENAFATAAAATLVYEVVSFALVALLLWRYLPRVSSSNRSQPTSSKSPTVQRTL
jgi:EmrB/QacA subfamily drug resistance transporter